MKKIVSFVLLICLMTTFVGCGKSNNDGNHADSQSKVDEQAKGRYVEEDLNSPPDAGRLTAMTKMEDGSLSVYDFYAGIYCSADEGVTWESKDSDVYEKYMEYYSRNMTLAPDGSGAMIYSSKSEDESEEEFNMNLHYLYITKDGIVQELELGMDYDTEDYITGFWFSPDSRLYGNSMDGKVYEIDIENSKPKLLFESSENIEYITFQNNIMIGLSIEAAYIYDLEKQVLMDEDSLLNKFIKAQVKDGVIEYTGGYYALILTPSKEDRVFYIACGDGMYRYVLYGNAMEQIIDGALSTFGNPQYKVMALQENDKGEYLVQFSDGKFVKYVYDENIPTVPEKELKIYSLEDNKVIRQAISTYQRAHQDTYVRFEAGVSNSDGVTFEDAIKKLNTDLMSGNGPDILVLDDMRTDSLIEKGLLADISGTINEIHKENPLFENFIQQNEVDGKLYMLPARFRIPLIIGPQDYLKNSIDLNSLADTVEEIRKQRPEGSIMGIYKPQQALRLFGSVSGSDFINNNNEIQQDVIREFLIQTQRIYKADIAGVTKQDIENFEGESMSTSDYNRTSEEEAYYLSLQMNVPKVYIDRTVMGAGYVEGILLDFSMITSIMEEKNEIDFQEFNGQQKNTLIPNTIIGISAKSENQESAQEFLKSVFIENQMNDSNGFPISKKAFEECLENSQGDEQFGAMGFPDDEGNTKILECYWPKLEHSQKLKEIVEKGIPYMDNSVINEAVYSIGEKVLTEEIDVDEAVEEISRKLAIYLAE